MVRVTVVMAFHRLDDFLFEAIDSVLVSEEQNIELILVSDRVNDTALEALRSRVTDPRVQILQSRGKGAGDARNLGFSQSSGTYVAIMDSDDIMLPSRLSTQAMYLDKYPRVVAVGSQVRFICPHGISKGKSSYRRIVPRNFLCKPFDSMVANPASMIRRDALDQIGGGYREQFSSTAVEDLDMWNRLLRVGEVHNLAGVLLKYRTHANQLSTVNRTKAILFSRLSLLFDIHESFGEPRYFLKSYPTLTGSEFSHLSSKEARETLTWRGRFRMHFFLMGVRAENMIDEARSQKQLASKKLTTTLPFASRFKLIVSAPLAFAVLFIQKMPFSKTQLESESKFSCGLCEN